MIGIKTTGGARGPEDRRERREGGGGQEKGTWQEREAKAREVTGARRSTRVWADHRYGGSGRLGSSGCDFEVDFCLKGASCEHRGRWKKSRSSLSVYISVLTPAQDPIHVHPWVPYDLTLSLALAFPSWRRV